MASCYVPTVLEGPWSRRNAYPRKPPFWYLITDRSGAVVESLRSLRVGRVADVRGWGCLVTIYRGLRVGVLALSDGGDVLPVTPEDDEASWQVESTGVPDRYSLIRTALDGSQTVASWTVGTGLRWEPPAEPPDERRPTPLPIERVSWPAPGGTLEGLLATPAGNGPFPLVVFLHGGPWFGLQAGDVGDSAFWISRGAALLQTDYAGSGILGEEMMWEPLRSVGMPDRDLEADGVIEGAQHLVRAGVADADRLYIYGFSAGGYLVNRIVTRPHPFAAAACWDAPADLRAFIRTNPRHPNLLPGMHTGRPP